ncbi:LytTR family DNA-binding domain-containing protein [Aquabacterium sp. A3]|uniref:LytR/AlgR family response regulator transcription factor n=1 Tax=Aquabacterium sp. A3 TaxID=3132829 RepID=UPI0031197EC3
MDPLIDEALRVVLIDDEPLARLRLRGLLAHSSVPNGVLAEFGEPVTALDALREQDLARDAADVVLLDIQMPGLDGMVLAARLREMRRPPAVVFVTAHAVHALRAFDLAAVDYLTKPVRLERLDAALAKARTWVHARRLSQAADVTDDDEVLVVRTRERLERIPLGAVLYFRAEQKIVSLRTADRTLVIDESLTELESRVGSRFVRVHRNALVARKAMRALERRHDDDEGGDGAEGWAVQVTPTQEWLQVSRRQVTAVRDAMAVSI